MKIAENRSWTDSGNVKVLDGPARELKRKHSPPRILIEAQVASAITTCQGRVFSQLGMVSHTREVTETQSREQPRIFNSQACHGQRWVLNFEGVAVGISEVVLTKRRANPTQR